jgi:hypothetical protein
VSGSSERRPEFCFLAGDFLAEKGGVMRSKDVCAVNGKWRVGKSTEEPPKRKDGVDSCRTALMHVLFELGLLGLCLPPLRTVGGVESD